MYSVFTMGKYKLGDILTENITYLTGLKENNNCHTHSCCFIGCKSERQCVGGTTEVFTQTHGTIGKGKNNNMNDILIMLK
jgi:hypothetical protein